ncbi:ATP-binding protein [Streptomyces sp. NPDC016845]|uniref:ATP-binding protein n=1 Tax=Streptomyces sp. NPDC016845 TaxID=3364972 RepID=UPI0037904EB1
MDYNLLPLFRHADAMDEVQLALASGLLARAGGSHAMRPATGTHLTPSTTDLVNALRDVLRIARSRDMEPLRLAGNVRSCTMIRTPGDDYSAARSARHHVRNTARAWQLSPATTDDLVTVTGELVANALEHGGGGTITLSCALTADTVTLTVTNEAEPGTQRPLPSAMPRLPSPDAEHGRGLLIVEALATRWGSSKTAQGLRVWAEIATDCEEPVTE